MAEIIHGDLVYVNLDEVIETVYQCRGDTANDEWEKRWLEPLESLPRIEFMKYPQVDGITPTLVTPEFSEDAISREWLKKWMFTEWDGNQLTAFKMTDFAPSVIPNAKEGEWIESPYENADGMTMYRCSECGCLCEGGYNYCFKCGAKMRDNNVETD